MREIKNYIYCIGLFLWCACTSNPKPALFEEFDLEANIKKTIDSTCTWNDLAAAVHIVPLETNDSVLLATFHISAVVGDQIIGINRVENRTAEGWIILSGSKSDLRIFNEQGKQVRVIDRKGKSGEEYTDLLTFMVEENPFTIKVIDNKRLLSYNEKGEYLRTDTLKKDYFNVIPLGKETYLAENSVFPISNYTFFVHLLDRQGNVKKELLPVTLDTLQLKKMSFTSYGMLRSRDGGAFYKPPYGDTLYRITPEGQVMPEAVFHCGDYRFAQVLKLKPGASWEEIEKMERNLIHLNSYDRWKDYFFIRYSWNKKNIQEVWKKGEGRPFVRKVGEAGKSGLALELEDGTSLNLVPDLIKNGKAYFIVEASQLAGHVRGMTEESNPALVIVTLK